MARVRISARVQRHAQLARVEGPGRLPHLEAVSGHGRVLVVERRTAARVFTRDTGLIETLFVDLGDTVDLSAQTTTLSGWTAIGLQYGSMRLTYLSMTATGSITLQRVTKRGLLGGEATVLAGETHLQFSAPLVDAASVRIADVQWSFTLDAAEF